jgi:NitT/TauT family transport system permease protein
MVVATNNMDGPLAFAGLTILALMGIALYALSLFVERRLTGWAYRRN